MHAAEIVVTLQLFQAVMARYGFAIGPVDIAKALVEGAKFQHGRLQTAEGDIAILSFDIYPDGLLVNARSTEDADKFVDDVIEWLRKEYKFRQPITTAPRIYGSAVVVEFEAEVDGLVKGLDKFKQAAQAAYKAAMSRDISLGLARLALMADPESVPPLTNTQFIIERRGGRPYSENRYYCVAPLPLAAHLELLEFFEQTMRPPTKH